MSEIADSASYNPRWPNGSVWAAKQNQSCISPKTSGTQIAPYEFLYKPSPAKEMLVGLQYKWASCAAESSCEEGQKKPNG